MSKINLKDSIPFYVPGDDLDSSQLRRGPQGIIEFLVRDRCKRLVTKIIEPNIVKISAKEMLSHRLPSSEVWDQQANGGVGAWVSSNLDPDEDFSARYVLLGASFDENGIPLDQQDDRFYQVDEVTGQTIPIRLTPGAEYDGGLINAIPLAEPDRPLKKIENIDFDPTYQPAGNPLLQDDVRALNNIAVLSTTLRLDEYNGFGQTDSDFFTITEIALAGGRKFNSIDDCECTPRSLFLQGIDSGSGTTGATESGEVPVAAIANGSDVVSIDPSVTNVDLIKEGDQIKLVGVDDTKSECSINQVSPFYLVLTKLAGGRDIQLDRTPVDTNDDPITGSVGLYKDTLRIFSHRVLTVPVKKSSNFEIEIKWRIIFN